MSTIFPGSASVGQIFDGYSFNGTAWDIIGIDLTADYLETSTASATYLNKVSASNTYLTQTSASSTYLTQVNASTTYLAQTSASTNYTPGIKLVKSQVVGSGVTSVVVNDAFSAAYDNYEILWTGGTMTSSSGDSQLYLSLNGATGSDYTTYLRYTNGTAMNVAAQTTTRFMWIGGGSTGSGLMQIKLYAPYLSVHTRSESNAYNSWNNGYFGSSNGVHTVSGSYTGFTVTVSGTGTMSNGTIRVYGYNNG